MNQSISDFAGHELSPGSQVVFISAPNTLQKGHVTGLRQVNKNLTVVEVVVDQNGKTHTLTAAPFVCARLS